MCLRILTSVLGLSALWATPVQSQVVSSAFGCFQRDDIGVLDMADRLAMDPQEAAFFLGLSSLESALGRYPDPVAHLAIDHQFLDWLIATERATQDAGSGLMMLSGLEVRGTPTSLTTCWHIHRGLQDGVRAPSDLAL